MSRIKPGCEKCGAPALVTIANEGSSMPSTATTQETQGAATMRYLCLRCADDEELSRQKRDASLNYSAILISVGLVSLFLSVFADWLGFGRSEGFGWKQDIGLVAAAVLVLTAAIVRIPTMLIIGVFTGALSILADLFQFGHERGFGWHQMMGTAFGIVLIGAGILESRRQT